MDLIVRLDWFVPQLVGVFYREQLFVPIALIYRSGLAGHGWLAITSGVCC